MTNIVTITANNYCHSVFDGTHATPKPCPNGYRLITSKNITGDGINISDAYFISEQDYFEINKRSKVYQWDILFSMIGTVGNLYLEENSDIDYAIKNIGVFSCRDEFKAKWLFYYLQSPMARNHIKRFLNGAVQKFLSLKQLRDFPILPFEKDKISIVEILSALDKKIALNKQINARLEEMAKTLYDYWFVQFDFPDANGKPYKSSGGDMVFDETLKREIPKGWKSRNILNIANLLGGGTPSKSSPEYWNGNIPFFTPTDCDNSIFILDTADKITDAGLCNSSTRLFKKHSIFMTARGSVGRSSINAVPMTMNQSCYAFQAKENVSYTFLFFLIRELIMILEVKATGSVFNSIVSSDIETTDLVIPDEDLIMKFGSFCEPLFNQIETNLKQNHHLTQLRDFLLPMLMNGQVSVAE